MPVELVKRLQRTAASIHRRRLLKNACWAFVALVASLAALIMLDRWLAVHQAGARSLLSALLIVGVWRIYRRWRAAAPPTISPLDVAHAVEQRRRLGSLVSSGVEFSTRDPDDPTTGSVDLQRAVVLRAAASVDEADLQSLLPRRSVRRAAAAAAATAIAAAIVGVASPSSLATGVSRLVNPWNDVQWPRRHLLRFEQAPQVVARGGRFRALLRDQQGTLPAQVVVEYRIERGDGHWGYHSQRVSAEGGSVQVQRANVQQSFEFRAAGGDDRQMPWQRVDVVDPPQLTSLEVWAEPPSYLGREPRKLAGPYQVVAGTKVRVSGRFDQPISSVSLATPDGDVVETVVDEGGTAFHMPGPAWQPEVSLEAWLRVTTAAGLNVRAAQLAVDVVDDQPPQARFLVPADQVALLPTARLPIEVHAADDFPVANVALNISGDARARSIPLVERAAGSSKTDAGLEVVAEHTLELTAEALHPGEHLVVHAMAVDLAGQTPRDPPSRRIDIVSRAELLRRLDAQRSAMLELVERARTEQRVSQRALQSSPPSVARALRSQRRVGAALVDGSGAVVGRLQVMLKAYQRNGLSELDAADRVSYWHGRFADLADQQILAAELELSDLVRTATPDAWTAQAAARRQIAATQAEIGSVLSAALREFGRWDAAEQFLRELLEIKETQQDLRGDTLDVARKWLAADEQGRAEVASDALHVDRRQSRLADRLADQLAAMRTASHAQDAAAAPAARLVQAARLAEDLALEVNMQAAAHRLSAQQFFKATVAQQAAIDALGQILAQSARAGETALAEQLERIREAEQRLQRVRDDLADHNRQIAIATPGEWEPLRVERAALAEGAGVLAQQLADVHPEAGQLANDAAEKLDEASDMRREDINREDFEQAGRRAADDLRAAQQSLAAERRRRQTDLAAAEARRLAQQIQQLARVQHGIADALADAVAVLAAQRTDDPSAVAIGNLDAPFLQRTQVLQQQTLRSTVELAQTLTQLPVFRYLLSEAQQSMQQVERGLAGNGAVQTIQDAARSAARQLQLAAEALAEQQRPPAADQPPDPEQPSPPSAEPDRASREQQEALQLMLAQLRLLRALQIRLQVDTEAFEAEARDRLSDVEVQRRSADLAERQRRLLELAAVVEQTEPPPDNAPQTLEPPRNP